MVKEQGASFDGTDSFCTELMGIEVRFTFFIAIGC